MSSEAIVFAGTRHKDKTPSFFKRLKVDSADVKECHYCHHLRHTKAEYFKLRECSHCGKRGHAKENCFKLQFGSGSRSYRGRGRNNYSQGYNHNISGHRRGANNADVLDEQLDHLLLVEYSDPLSVDPSSMHDATFVQNSQVSKIDSNMVTGLVTTLIRQVVKAFSDKQHTGLSSSNFAGTVLQSSARSTLKYHETCNWIVDTGASNHMTSHVALLHNVISLQKPVLVGLPDGTVKHVY
ncbi:hypothetical protein RND81_05G068200 [Saponaria officinalis]|uniref:CCHC-type domain-containing protein n=1 Tax=Saponaria officinalis TaxID=3572 RepID=A0AAW1KV75_SAPOF